MIEKIPEADAVTIELNKRIRRVWNTVLDSESDEMNSDYFNSVAHFRPELEQALEAAGFSASEKNIMPEYHELIGSTFVATEVPDPVAHELVRKEIERFLNDFVLRYDLVVGDGEASE